MAVRAPAFVIMSLADLINLTSDGSLFPMGLDKVVCLHGEIACKSQHTHATARLEKQNVKSLRRLANFVTIYP
jgi:hypothetical protein